jgi:flagellar hook-length control protein FliK
MPLPATGSPALSSAFDLVGGECFAGPTAGRPSIDLARSDGAIDSFDDLLKDALSGAEGLALLGFNPTTTPAPVAPPAKGELSNTIDFGSGDSFPSASGANDAAMNLRQLVLRGLRPPVVNELESVITPAIESDARSTDASLQRAIAVSSERSSGEFTIPSVESKSDLPAPPMIDDGGVVVSSIEPAFPVATREVSAETEPSLIDVAATNDATEPVILSLDERRQQIASSAADAKAPTRRDSQFLDEANRAQLLPFAPIVQHSGKTTAIGVTGIEVSATGSQSLGARVIGVDDQVSETPIDSAIPASPESEHLEDAAEEPAVTDATASSPAEQNADPTLDVGDVTQMTVEAALVPAAVVGSNTPSAVQEDSATSRIGSPTGEIERRGPGVRTSETKSADELSFNETDAVAEENAAPALRPSRPRPEVVAAARRINDPGTADDLSSPAQASAASNSGDVSSQSEPATTEPSVVQQVSQAVETWRDSLQEQGSARFAAWLSPPDLGHVWVELTRSGEGITARLKASDDSVQSLLESQEPELRQALNDSGISVAELDLSGRPAGDFASDQHHQQPDQHEDAGTSALGFAGPVRRGTSSNRSSAIDVRA